MSKKGRLEDVNIMEGIDFIKNQNRMKRLNARIRREKILYNSLYVLVIIALVLTIFVAFKNSKQHKCNTEFNKKYYGVEIR